MDLQPAKISAHARVLDARSWCEHVGILGYLGQHLESMVCFGWCAGCITKSWAKRYVSLCLKSDKTLMLDGELPIHTTINTKISIVTPSLHDIPSLRFWHYKAMTWCDMIWSAMIILWFDMIQFWFWYDRIWFDVLWFDYDMTMIKMIWYAII